MHPPPGCSATCRRNGRGDLFDDILALRGAKLFQAGGFLKWDIYMASRKHTCKGYRSRGLNHAVTYRQLGLADSDNTSKRLIRCSEHGLCTYVINCSYYTPLFQTNNSGVIKQGCWMYGATLGLACWEWE